MDIILIRHGETEANINKVFSPFDVKLSSRGKEQILKSKEYIHSLDFNKVYVSPLNRAIDTMKLLDLNGEIENRIREIDFGILEGKSYVEANGEYPVETEKWANDPMNYAVPRGETLISAYKRIEEFLCELIKKDENVILICHEGIIKLALCFVFDNPEYFFRFKAENVSISSITIEQGHKYISKMNHILY